MRESGITGKRWNAVVEQEAAMRRAMAAGCGMAVALMALPVGSARQNSAEKAKEELLELENHWLQVEDDPEALEPILADDFLHVVPVGIITKKEQLDFVRKHPARQKGARHFEDMHVRSYGNVGIVNGMVVAVTDEGTEKTLFTDVFAYRDGKWQAVSAQELAVGKR